MRLATADEESDDVDVGTVYGEEDVRFMPPKEIRRELGARNPGSAADGVDR